MILLVLRLIVIIDSQSGFIDSEYKKKWENRLKTL